MLTRAPVKMPSVCGWPSECAQSSRFFLATLWRGALSDGELTAFGLRKGSSIAMEGTVQSEPGARPISGALEIANSHRALEIAAFSGTSG